MTRAKERNNQVYFSHYGDVHLFDSGALITGEYFQINRGLLDIVEQQADEVHSGVSHPSTVEWEKPSPIFWSGEGGCMNMILESLRRIGF